jgi:hypothetical protein
MRRFEPCRLRFPDCGGVAQMVERSLSMREVQGSIPCISTTAFDSSRGAFSSVVERPFCIRKAEGSNPSSSTLPLQEKVDTEGFEPSTSRMRNGRSSTELSALWWKWCVSRESNPGRLRGGEPFYH